MATFNVTAVENKSGDWKVISIQENGGREITNVSVNRFKKDSKEDQWAGKFDSIAPDTTVEGEYWRSPSNKNFLFPPKKANAVPGFKNSGAVKIAQERKSEMIATAQENKGLGIKTSSTIRMAVDLAIAQYADPNNLDTMPELITKWREWLWREWDQPEKNPIYPN